MEVQPSLELEKTSGKDDVDTIRTGTLWTAVAHIIAAEIGAGVLSLAWGTAQLGWIAGPITMLCFAVITYISATLICDCYRSPDPITGTRNPSYIDAVRATLGKKWTWLCGLLQYVSFYGYGVVYVITSATSIREIQISNCYHEGGEKAVCQSGRNVFMLIFGIIQIVMSQTPDFHNMVWLSVVAALMSFCYSFIGLGLGFSKVIDNKGIKGSIVGVPTRSVAQKIWLVFQGLGDIAFAYPYSIIVLEIQDTLKSSPPENQTMKKASITSTVIITFFYLCCSCFGYAAFGNDTPGNLLTGFYEPFWLVDFANACIVLHLVGAYQVYCQPIFAFVEKWATQKYPENRFLNKFYAIKLPVLPALQLNLFRLCFRTLYVISTTAIAIAFPYFNQILLTEANMCTHRKNSGNEWTALAHIITAVIGSGVLSLAWSMAQLGWIAGPLTMLLFSCVSLTSAFLICNCYKSPDPETGPDRNGSYVEAVQKILGKRNALFCGIIVRINFIKVAIVYTITSSISMRAIQQSNCYHDQGHDATCGYESTRYMVIFGLVQVIVSQIPDFQNMKWLSVVAAVMSFTYSIIGSALGLAKVIENGEIKGSITGLPSSTAAEKVWLVAQALGDIAFAFPFSLVYLEVQDTLKAPPPEKITMKKVSIMTVCITTFFYLCCGGFGYAAFGNSTPGNLLTGFGFYEPYWLVDFANACVVLHLIGGYQIFSQPLFADIERWFARKFPESKFVHKNHSVKHLPMLPLRLNFMRLLFRTAYVALITGIAVLFPYFNQMIGVSGAITFWPVVIYFPVEMYLTQEKIESWKSKAIALRVFAIVCLVVILYAFVGSVRGVIVARFG